MMTGRRSRAAVRFAAVLSVSVLLAGAAAAGHPAWVPADELARCDGCRNELMDCYQKSKDEDAETKKRSREKCNQEAVRCFEKCESR